MPQLFTAYRDIYIKADDNANIHIAGLVKTAFCAAATAFLSVIGIPFSANFSPLY